MFSLLAFTYSSRPIKQIKTNKRSRAICGQIPVSHGMRINSSLNNSKVMKKCLSGTVLQVSRRSRAGRRLSCAGHGETPEPLRAPL